MTRPARRAGRPVTDEATSRRMAGIRQKDTVPELAVRRALTRLGLRYRVRNRDLPGSPDVANRAGRWAIFVHGCYWHRHPGCRRTTTPRRNVDFWTTKFGANVARDARATDALWQQGFAVVTIWECEAERGDEDLAALLRQRLEEALATTSTSAGRATRRGGRRG